MIDKLKLFDAQRVKDKWYIPPRGNPNGRLMLVLSHPGHDDLESGKLLNGSYKTEVMSAIQQAGIDPNDVYITSMVKEGIGNAKMSAEMIAKWAELLDFEFDLVKPKLIMTLGAEECQEARGFAG